MLMEGCYMRNRACHGPFQRNFAGIVGSVWVQWEAFGGLLEQLQSLQKLVVIAEMLDEYWRMACAALEGAASLKSTIA